MPQRPSYFSGFFKLIDIFGLKTEFRIDEKPRFKTTSGGIFTLIFLVSIFLLFFSFGSDMINRVSPETTISQIYQAAPAATLIHKDQYSFVFGMQDSDGNHFIDEEIYTASLMYAHRNQTTKQDMYEQISLERCSQKSMPNNPKISKYYNNIAMSLNDLYCISQNETKELVMQGAWDQEQFNYIKINIAPCNSSQKKCKSDEEINNMLKSGFFAFYSVDNLFDLRNYESPAQIFGRDYFIETTTSIKKIITRYLKTTHISEDSGWITDDTTVDHYFSFDYDRESFELLSKSDYLVDFVVRKSTYETVLSRKYKKIQNVFAEMNGFLQIIFTILFLLSNPFIKKEYYESLTNSIYNFEVDEEEKTNKNSKKRKKSMGTLQKDLYTFRTLVMEKDMQISMGEGLKNNSATVRKEKERKKSDIELANRLFKLKESPLNLGYFDLIRSVFSSKPELSAKKHQRKKGISSIFSQLDIKFILKKFSEIDKLKMLLLNEDQYHLFQYLPKPIIMKNAKISINYKRKSAKMEFSNNFGLQNDLVFKAKAVQKAYENITKKKQMTDIDRKLIESLDEDILLLLQKYNENVENEAKILMSPHQKVEEGESVDMQDGKESTFDEKKADIEIFIRERKGGNPSFCLERKE